MGGFNLPPGCSVSDLPGNTRQDAIEEAIWEEIDKCLVEVPDNLCQSVGEKIRKLIDKSYEDGYGAARNDAAEEKYYLEQKEQRQVNEQ